MSSTFLGTAAGMTVNMLALEIIISWLETDSVKMTEEPPFAYNLSGSLSTVVGDEKLTSREDLIGLLFFYVQSD